MSIAPSPIFKIPSFHTVIFLFFSALVFYSCSQPIDVEGFDAKAWKSDKRACNNSRADYEQVIVAARNQLVGSTQEDIIRFLGRPEKQELYTRGQKFYIYYLSPSPECDENINPTGPSRYLYVRFSALNKVNEIFVQQL